VPVLQAAGRRARAEKNFMQNSMKRKLLVGAVLVVSAALTAGMLFLAGSVKHVAAAIQSVDAAGGYVVVRAPEDEALTLEMGAGTRISLDGRPALASQLQKGMSASILYDPDTRQIEILRVTSGARENPVGEGGGPSDDPSVAAAADGAAAGGAAEAAKNTPADWPQWRGPRQDGISRERGLLRQWPAEGPPVLWSVPCGEGYSAVAVIKDRLYFMDQHDGKEWVRCLGTADGQQVWAKSVSEGYEDSFGNGPRATPTVDGGLVFAQAAAGNVVCLDAGTGTIKWQKDLLAEIGQENIRWGISGSPLVLGDRVWLNPGLVLDKKTGERLLLAVDDAPGYATPVALRLGDTPIVFCFTASGLVGLHAESGKELFRHEWTTDYDCNIATPIVEGNLVFISSGYDTGCALLELFAKRGEVTAREVYRNREMRNHFASCILHERHLYGFDEGMFTCLEMQSGKQMWRERGWDKGALVMADGMLIVLGEHGRLSLVRPNPERLEVVSDVDALSGRCWTMPVVSGGRLYVRNESVMKCLDLRGP
jgi:hypothetical protein